MLKLWLQADETRKMSQRKNMTNRIKWNRVDRLRRFSLPSQATERTVGFRIGNGYLNDYKVLTGRCFRARRATATVVTRCDRCGKRAAKPTAVTSIHSTIRCNCLAPTNQVTCARSVRVVPSAIILRSRPIAALRDEENGFALFCSPTGDAFAPRLGLALRPFSRCPVDPRHGDEEIVAHSNLESVRFQPLVWGRAGF